MTSKKLPATTQAQVQAFLSSLVDAMNDLNTNLHLVEFLCFGAMLCVLLFSLIIVSGKL